MNVKNWNYKRQFTRVMFGNKMLKQHLMWHIMLPQSLEEWQPKIGYIIQC